MNQNLEYHVPQLGKISIKLYPSAAETYNLLDHYGHIDRMRKIDQLGVIRSVYEGAHHSRWEYVMVQLSLVNQLSGIKYDGDARSSGLGLSSNINISGQNLSGADVLQIWILLFNSGHLPGTFATERAFLRYCQKHDYLKETIYGGLPNKQEIRDDFRNILNEDHVYSFHKILISFHLERYRRYKCKIPNFIDFLQDIIIFYTSKSNEHTKKQENLKNIFRRVRQISYLFLDSHYGPVPINFNLSTIFLNFSDYTRQLFKERDTSIIRTLDSFEDFLSINMYHSAEAIRELGSHVRRIEQIIDKNKEEKKLRKITGFHKYLINNSNDFQSHHNDWENSLNIYVLFEIYPFLIDTIKKNISYDLEEKWNKKYGEKSCNLTFQLSPTSKQMAITLSFLQESKIQRNIGILGNFLKDMIELNNKMKNNMVTKIHSFFIDEVFQRPYQELLLSILRYISNNNLNFEFKTYSPVELPVFSINGSKNAAKEIGDKLKNIDSSYERFHEIKTLQDSLLDLSHNSGLLLSLSQIMVFDNNQKHLTDIDGFGLGYKNGDLGVLIVEAKNQKKGSRSASKKQLEETLEKLKFKTSENPKIVQLSKGAYCYLKIDGLGNIQLDPSMFSARPTKKKRINLKPLTV